MFLTVRIIKYLLQKMSNFWRKRKQINKPVMALISKHVVQNRLWNWVGIFTIRNSCPFSRTYLTIDQPRWLHDGDTITWLFDIIRGGAVYSKLHVTDWQRKIRSIINWILLKLQIAVIYSIFKLCFGRLKNILNK